jgi:hypothetical protein
MRNITVPLLLAIQVFTLCSCGGDSSGSVDSAAASPATPACNGSTVEAAASTKLVEWIDQNIVKGSVSAPLVVNIIALSGSPSGAGGMQCRASFSVAFSEASGNLFGGFYPNNFTTEFFLSGAPDSPQITLNSDEMRSATFDEVSAIMGFERERERRTSMQGK